MAKSNGNTVLLRVSEIATMLIDAYSRSEIVQYVADSWNVGERMADTYISKAREEIKASVKKDILYDYAKAVRRYEDLYSKVMDRKDYKTALAINKELTTLQGLLKNSIEQSNTITFINSVPN